MKNLNIAKIYPNPDQPRKDFKPAKLQELADSIKENGLMEPLIVAKRADKYMIIAGERRYRACKIAGKGTVPARVITASKRKIAELALLENLQREDLNLIEEAKGYQRILDMGISIEALAKKIGFQQTWRIQERLNLLKLDPLYQDLLIKKVITPSQAQEMSRLSPEGQLLLFRKIKEGKAATYNQLRAVTSAILFKEQQTTFVPEPTEKQVTVKKKYDQVLQSVLSLISRSFSADDMSVLKSVLDSSITANIKKIDLIIDYLHKIKRSMLKAQGTQDVLFN